MIEALRPRQWTKNLLLFAGVIFSQHLRDPRLLGRAAVGFVAFSLLAGIVYVVNDLRDVEQDRQHPRKRLRPIPSGRLSMTAARIALVPIAAVVIALSWWLGPGFAVTALVYMALNLAYSFGLKHQVLLDVFVVALGFVLRAIAGVQLLVPVAPGTELSPWLLVCTFFGALFLALGKRRRELTNAGDTAAVRRAVLDHYTPELVDQLLVIAAAASLMSYALYTIWPGTVAKFHTEALLFTVPFVAYGLFRYLWLIETTEHSEDPSQILLTDRPLAVNLLLYLGVVLVILYRV
ncbi:MAG: decaprenyl-phosphate phosphoribosyltransferase [Candidatus Eisenbacteria bacterium]